jgi:sec-independent protein translocase protein TatC
MEEMTFWDHLEELRKVIFRCLGAALAVSIGFFIIMPKIFDSLIMGPCFGKFPTYNFFCYLSRFITLPSSFCDKSFEIHIINIQLTSQFLIHIRTSFILASVVICPYILFEIWKFISPALYEKEKRSFQFSFILGALLFYIGILISYYLIFPITLQFLAGYQISQHVVNELSFDSYISTFTSMNLVMGVVFELPMLALILSKLGLINRSFFRKYRRHAIVILVFVAAVITPTGDPFTLTIVALPLYLLYELSAIIVHDDRKDKSESAEHIKKQGN